MPNKWLLVGGGVVAVLVGLLTAYWLGTHVGDVTGRAVCETTHATTQLGINTKTKGAYDKIDRSTPRTSDRAASLKWLRESAAGNRQ